MKRRRRILAGIVLVVALMAAAGALVHHFIGRGPPPHLAKRLPPLEAMPVGLTADQQAAIRLLYSLNPSERMRGVEMMNATVIPTDAQVPYLVALLADDPKLQNEHPTSPLETWFWKLLGTKWATEDVQDTCRSILRSMDDHVAAAMIRATKTEPDVEIRRELVRAMAYMPSNYKRNLASPPGPDIPRCPDPALPEGLADLFQNDPDAGVRDEAVAAFSIVEEEIRSDRSLKETRFTGLDSRGALPNETTALNPRHLEALLAAARSDRNVSVRMTAVEALSRHLGPDAVAPLADIAATDPEPRVREHASWLLSSPGSNAGGGLYARVIARALPPRPRVIEALIDALRQEALHPRDRSSEIRTSLRSALCDLTDQDFGQDAAKWQAWFDAHQADFDQTPVKAAAP